MASIDNEDPIASLLLKMRLRDKVSDHEADVLRSAVEKVEDVPAGRTLVTAGHPLHYSTLLIDGFVSRFKDLNDGQRQITELHVAGDFVDLHGYLLKRLEHCIGALSAVRIALVPHDKLTEITEREPHLARLLWLGTLIDAAIQRERILSLGRRSAIGRVANLICELVARLEIVGQNAGAGFRFPVTQLDLADATGLTPVHVNRMLRKLRGDGLMTFRGGQVEIHDREGLERVAEFDRSYLFLESFPR